ncbi:hypothetical protein TSMEX_009831 [Taenia solium]
MSPIAFGDLSYPPPCCKQNVTEVNYQQQSNQNCTKEEAKRQEVGGCGEKIKKFLTENLRFFLGISCFVLVLQILVLLIMCALYKEWKEE